MFSWQCWSTSSEPALASFKVTCSRLSCGKVLMLVAHSQRCKETDAALNPGLCFRKPHVFKISSKSLHVKATASASSWSILSRTRLRHPPWSTMVRMLSFICQALVGCGRVACCPVVVRHSTDSKNLATNNRAMNNLATNNLVTNNRVTNNHVTNRARSLVTG